MKHRLLYSILFLVSFAQAEQVAPLVTEPARASGVTAVYTADGVVEAVRQTVLAAQVAGAIVDLRVKVGDTVKAGQVLVRIDARAADQSAIASQAQVGAARANLDVAAKDFSRQKQLFQKGFISQAAFDQAEAVYKAAEAGVNAQFAQASAARTQTDFFTLRSPYNGIVSEVPVVQGDMAMPGRAIVTVYDPAALRVTATVPQTAILSAALLQSARIELPGAAQGPIVPSRATLLPTADPNTHTMQIRFDLPAGTKDAAPGMFARALLPAAATDGASRILVSAKSVVRRAEMTGVYVVDAAGKPALRQVRVGRATADSIEILAGISANERIATDPQAAARGR